MAPFVIRPAAKFAEPAFSRLSREVFDGLQQPSLDWASVVAEEKAGAPAATHAHSAMHRLGAYLGDELIGWSCGWMERGNVFYMANSGVVPAHRRKGVYSALLDGVRAHALASGAVALRSQHSVLNNPILIAKLRSGFHISGLSQSAQMGTLVELTLHLFGQREAVFRSRCLPCMEPEAAASDEPQRSNTP